MDKFVYVVYEQYEDGSQELDRIFTKESLAVDFLAEQDSEDFYYQCIQLRNCQEEKI